MKTKKFFMTSLLVMGMIIAKAANGFPPELVLVSQPVLTYNPNSVTIYYDVQNIGDYTYRGNLYIYLDPDNGRYYGEKYVKVRPNSIRRIAVTIPLNRINPSWVYTVMPYYELYDELFSFTTFEYFEPVRFHWYGYRNDPWVVIHVGPRPRHYYRPSEYRYYYDGYRPMVPPPGAHHDSHNMPPMDPHHHTYSYHHSNGGYPANFTPDHETPGYNKPAEATVVRPNGGNTAGSMSSRTNANPSSNNNGNNSGVTSRPSGNNNNNNSGTSGRPSGNSGNAGSTSNRPSGNNDSGNSRPSGNNSNNSGSVSRPSGNSSNNAGSTSNRPSGNSDSGNKRPSSNSSNNSGSVSRPSGSSSNNSSGTSSGRGNSSSSSSRSNSSSNSRSSGSNTSNSSRGNSSSRGSR